MALRTLLGCLPVTAIAICALTACKDSGDSKEDAGVKVQATAEQLNRRCEQLGKACGEKDKHQEQIVEECKQAAKTQVEKACTNKAIAVYDCYEKEICAKNDKVWAIDDLRVLADRYGKCVAERNAGRECVGGAKE
jgi:hypothetical protein